MVGLNYVEEEEDVWIVGGFVWQDRGRNIVIR